jgi:hypothetical protein
MAFIILGDREQEWERRPLRTPITIGRSFDCELPVRDTLLSRKHCRLEPHGTQWVLIDLNSRNGTRVGDSPITRHVLEDGEIVRIGQTQLCFKSGPFVPAKVPSLIPSRGRPLDPHEAMAATMTGATLMAEPPDLQIPGFPTPKPKPTEPKAYHEEGVGVLVSRLASATWDDRLANQALKRRPAVAQKWPAPVAKVSNRPASATALDEKPARWLVMTYLALASGVFAACMLAILWPGI